MIKRVVLSLVAVFGIIAIILLIFSYNNLVTISPSPYVSYKVARIPLEDRFSNPSYVVGSNTLVRFSDDDYVYISVEPVSTMVSVVGDNYHYFYRVRIDIYDLPVNALPPYTQGAPLVLVNVSALPSGTNADGQNLYTVRIFDAYIDYSFSYLVNAFSYDIDYQKYMSENSPVLQRPDAPDYSVNSFDDVGKIIIQFFIYVGSCFEYFINKLEFAFNYIKFPIEDISSAWSF